MSWPVRTDNMLVINCCLRILRMFIIRRCPLFPFYPVLFCALIFLDVYLSIIHCCFDICGNTYIPDVFPFCYWLLSYSRRENAVWGVGLALFQSQRKTMSDVFVFPGDVGDMLFFQTHGVIIRRQFEFLVTVQHWFYHQKPSIINTFSFTSHVQRWIFLRSVPAENSLLRFASEDKTPGEDFLLGRSLSQNRRKTDRGGGSTHYTLIPAVQMEVSTSSSDSASLYHVSTTPPPQILTKSPFIPTSHRHCFPASSQVFERSSMRSRSKKKSKGTRVWRRVQSRAVGLFGDFLNLFCRLQLEAPCLPSVRGGYPAGTWVRGTAKAGCGKRRMLKPISHRSGRNTGSSWKTRVYIGTWMRRWTQFLKKNSLHHLAFFCNILFIIIKLHRMRRQKALSAFQSSRLIVPLNAAGSSECLFSLANTPSSCWRI